MPQLSCTSSGSKASEKKRPVHMRITQAMAKVSRPMCRQWATWVASCANDRKKTPHRHAWMTGTTAHPVKG